MTLLTRLGPNAPVRTDGPMHHGNGRAHHRIATKPATLSSVVRIHSLRLLVPRDLTDCRELTNRAFIMQTGPAAKLRWMTRKRTVEGFRFRRMKAATLRNEGVPGVRRPGAYAARAPSVMAAAKRLSPCVQWVPPAPWSVTVVSTTLVSEPFAESSARYRENLRRPRLPAQKSSRRTIDIPVKSRGAH